MSLHRAAALIHTGGNPIFDLQPEFQSLFNGTILDVPSAVALVAAIALVVWVVLNKTPLGEYPMALGGNAEAAHIAGVPLARTKMAAHTISRALAAVAALILIGRIGAAEPTLGDHRDLDAIAAAMLVDRATWRRG